MELSPPANSDIATRQDLEVAVERVRSEILARLDTAQWRIIGAMIVLHGGTVGLSTLSLG